MKNQVWSENSLSIYDLLSYCFGNSLILYSQSWNEFDLYLPVWPRSPYQLNLYDQTTLCNFPKTYDIDTWNFETKDIAMTTSSNGSIL
jgi:hypothetical protein